jgi:phosphoribosyl-ATP pyrophosphohydrolase
VQQWATDRGIYEHSTSTAQALKACSEAGELCDAVIKNDREALIDAIGDVAVCIVNASAMLGFTGINPVENPWHDKQLGLMVGSVVVQCGALVKAIEYGEPTDAWDFASDALYHLCAICKLKGLDFEDCCESAWLEIKDRKGRMVPGGAFVKE